MPAELNISDELIINAIDAADIGYWARVELGADTAKMLKGEATAIIFDKDGSLYRQGRRMA
jgi:hypothetical protein